jgi:hypothetical protein
MVEGVRKFYSDLVSCFHVMEGLGMGKWSNSNKFL